MESSRRTVLVLYSDPSRKALIENSAAQNNAFQLLLQRVNPATSVGKQLAEIREHLDDSDRNIQAITGTNDFASALASAICQERDFPGPCLDSVYQAQHKTLFARHAATVSSHFPSTKLVLSKADLAGKNGWYPGFIKPAAGSLSDAAFLVKSPEHLQGKYKQVANGQRVDVRWREELFNSLIRPNDPALSAFLLQPYLSCPQYTVDGYVFEGEVHWIGVTASIFDHAGHSFERFDFPANLDQNTSSELEQEVENLIDRIGYDSGCFNVEFFVTPDGHVALIEFNTRQAFQFVPLFTTRYDMDYFIESCRLALGEKPIMALCSNPQTASSCVLRVYQDAQVVSIPSSADIQAIIEDEIAHSVRVMVQPGRRLSDIKQDEYSYRYAIINIIGSDRSEINEKLAIAKERLKFVFK